MRFRWPILIVPLLCALVAIGILWPGPFDALDDLYILGSFAFYVCGAVLLFKTPANAVGWLLMAYPLLASLSLVPLALSARWGSGSAASWANVIAYVFSTPSLNPLALALLYFPTGRLPSRRWRPGAAVIIIGAVAGSGAALLNGGWGGDSVPGSAVSPLRSMTGPVGDILSTVFFLLLLASFLIAGVSLIDRYRRAQGMERNQIKWMTLSGACLIILLLTSVFAVGLSAIDSTLGEAVFVATMMTIPLGITIAVTRYKLYEIDHLISRTFGYALVLGLLALVFAAGTIWLPTLFVDELPTPLNGKETPLFVAASTLVLAALFNPIRRRVLRWVDRRFDRSRYDAEVVLDDFAMHLRDRVDAEELAEDWSGVVEQTFRPSSIGVWLRE